MLVLRQDAEGAFIVGECSLIAKRDQAKINIGVTIHPVPGYTAVKMEEFRVVGFTIPGYRYPVRAILLKHGQQPRVLPHWTPRII